MSASLEIHIANSVNMHAANYLHLKQKATPETGGKTGNWNVLWFLSLWWEILPCLLPQRPKLRKKKVVLQSIPIMKTQEKPQHQPFRGSNTDSSCHSVSTGFLVWGVISVLVWWWFGLIFKGASWFYLSQQQHRTAPRQNMAHSAGYGLLRL